MKNDIYRAISFYPLNDLLTYLLTCLHLFYLFQEVTGCRIDRMAEMDVEIGCSCRSLLVHGVIENVVQKSRLILKIKEFYAPINGAVTDQYGAATDRPMHDLGPRPWPPRFFRSCYRLPTQKSRYEKL